MSYDPVEIVRFEKVIGTVVSKYRVEIFSDGGAVVLDEDKDAIVGIFEDEGFEAKPEVYKEAFAYVEKLGYRRIG